MFEDGFPAAIGIDAFCEERHLLVAPSGELSGAVDSALAKQRRTRAVVAGSSGFMVAGWMAAEADCILTAPSKLLDVLARHLPLAIFAPPASLSEDLTPIRIVSVWHARNDGDAAHRWFREALRATLT